MDKLIPQEVVQQKIFVIRGQKVMLSMHLAELYEVQPKVLIQAVKRNIDRFPEDFMFQLSKEEHKNLKSQIVTSSWGGIRRANPYAFTEQGIAMLSSVLKSKKAIHVNIVIIRTFVKLRRFLTTHKVLAHRIRNLENKVGEHDDYIANVMQVIKTIQSPQIENKPKRKIGFR
jgi:hypothetical protein